MWVKLNSGKAHITKYYTFIFHSSNPAGLWDFYLRSQARLYDLLDTRTQKKAVELISRIMDSEERRRITKILEG